MKRGSAIKLTRIRKGLKQRELVSATHSKSLISRIENDDSEVQEGHYDYFINKLEIDFPKLLEQEVEMGKKIENLFIYTHYLQLEEAEKLHKELQKQEDFIKFSDHFIQYTLYKFFFLIQTNNLSKAEIVWNELQNVNNNLLIYETVLAEFFYSIYLIYKGDFKTADINFTKFLTNEKNISFVNTGDLYFYVSKAKTGLHDYSAATFFATKATSYYNEHFNYKRGIVAAELLISLYISTEMYDEALKLLKKLFRFENVLNLLPNEKPILYHLKGSVYKKKGQPEKAIELYQKSLQFNQPIDATLLLMQFNLCVLLFKCKDQTCRDEIFKLLKLAESIKNEEYVVLAKFYNLLLENEIEAIQYIEKNIEVVHSVKMNREARSEIYLNLSDYYSKTRNVLKAIMYVNYWKELKN
ncbi:MAG: hypothetical protein K0R71_2017 [Bacillales bacterium]|jgi:transcriptional regulator with XRE-family HTH domain|nr:hypothetical protein [Bacillales bacterium]